MDANVLYTYLSSKVNTNRTRHLCRFTRIKLPENIRDPHSHFHITWIIFSIQKTYHTTCYVSFLVPLVIPIILFALYILSTFSLRFSFQLLSFPCRIVLFSFLLAARYIHYFFVSLLRLLEIHFLILLLLYLLFFTDEATLFVYMFSANFNWKYKHPFFLIFRSYVMHWAFRIKRILYIKLRVDEISNSTSSGDSGNGSSMHNSSTKVDGDMEKWRCVLSILSTLFPLHLHTLQLPLFYF